MHLKIVNIKKFVRSIIVILGIIMFFSMITLNNTYSKSEIKYKEEYIVAGDTIWSIANEELQNNLKYKNTDIRDIVSEIKDVNQIQNNNLEVGQKLLIPVL